MGAGQLTVECINCGHSIWSIKEENRCPRCGSLMLRVEVEKEKKDEAKGME